MNISLGVLCYLASYASKMLQVKQEGSGMRKLLGGIVLAAGVAGLGYWGAKDHALDMQNAIDARAAEAVTGALHAVQTQAIGRDIRITGLADSEAERDMLITSLNNVEGRRVVLDALEILPTADPFTIAATRKDGQMRLQGNVPSEAMRAALVQSPVVRPQSRGPSFRMASSARF